MVTAVISAFKRLKQEEHEFVVSLGYVVKTLSQRNKQAYTRMVKWLRHWT